MKKQRKNKVIVIVALISSVIVMSIGFAVFSDVLTISSSATVTPNEDDFKIKIYGLTSSDAIDTLLGSGKEPSAATLSDSMGTAINFNSATSTNAIINNATYTISNIKASLIYPGDETIYVFMIRNEGAYDAYIDLGEGRVETENGITTYNGFYSPNKTCKAGTGATSALVSAACEYVENQTVVADSSLNPISTELSYYKISVGEYIYIVTGPMYLSGNETALADGPFTVEFDPIEFNFSTAPPSSN